MICCVGELVNGKDVHTDYGVSLFHSIREFSCIVGLLMPVTSPRGVLWMLILLFELCLVVADVTGLVGDTMVAVLLGLECAWPNPSEKRHHELRTSSMLTLAKSMLELRPDVCARRLPCCRGDPLLLLLPPSEPVESLDPDEKEEVAEVGRLFHQLFVGEGPCVCRMGLSECAVSLNGRKGGEERAVLFLLFRLARRKAKKASAARSSTPRTVTTPITILRFLLVEAWPLAAKPLREEAPLVPSVVAELETPCAAYEVRGRSGLTTWARSFATPLLLV